MKSIIASFIKAQAQIQNAVKDAKNPHFKNNYATLESVLDAVKPVANANGLAIIQVNGRDEKGDYVETILAHETGEMLTSKCYLHFSKQDMQGLGSAITYARRYSLAAMFSITQEDDDGNTANSLPRMDVQPIKRTSADLGDYIIPIGKDIKGKRLKDAKREEIEGLLKWLEGKEINGPAVEFSKNARTYLELKV